MEDRGDHRAAVVVILAVLIVGAVIHPAMAEEPLPPYKPPPSVTVTTEPDGAVVEAGTSASTPGRTPTKVTGHRKCYLEPDTAPITTTNVHIYAPRRDEVSFRLICDGEFLGLVWRPRDPGTSSFSPATPREVALYLREEIPIPRATVSVNPEIGLVGTDSWFWIEGYSGEVISDSTDAFGQVVEVEARVTSYEWSFGDGTIYPSTTPGRAYPERSEIRHTYQRSSDGFESGYPVEVSFEFAVKYRVGGGSWIDLPAITRSSSFRYPVRESQAVIQR